MNSYDEISNMFQIESNKLQNLIDNASLKSDLTPHEIVEMYYQVMNVSSMISMLKQQPDGEKSKSLLENITDYETMISDKFNSQIHPKTMELLSQSIQETTKNLQSRSTEQKSKEDIENEAKFYEELRQKMSTKEFVEQYDKGLQND